MDKKLDEESFQDPRLGPVCLDLTQDREGRWTNRVVFLVRVDRLVSDDSGECPGEKFAEVAITRQELARLCHDAERDWTDQVIYGPPDGEMAPAPRYPT